MKFSATELIEAPRPFVFARAAELKRLARLAEARGAAVVRHPRDPETGRGLRFDIAYTYRNTPLAAELELVRRLPPESLGLAVASALVSGRVDAAFEALTDIRTRVHLEVELAPQSVKGRMLLASFRLVQARLQSRLERDVAAAARAVERMWQDGETEPPPLWRGPGMGPGRGHGGGHGGGRGRGPGGGAGRGPGRGQGGGAGPGARARDT